MVEIERVWKSTQYAPPFYPRSSDSVFTKDGAGSHHGHLFEYSELKVPSEVSQDPLGLKL